MKVLFLAYRILATIVGVAIILLVLVGVPLKYSHKVWPDLWPSFLENGEPGNNLGVWISSNIGVAHGFIYMVFLLCVLLIAVTMRWKVPFILIILVSGLIPFLTFWAEKQVVRKVRNAYPELS